MRAELGKTLEQLLSGYFTKGVFYLETEEFSRIYQQQMISLSSINRHFQKLNLSRHPVERIRTDDTTLLAVVREELSGSRSNVGYKKVWDHWDLGCLMRGCSSCHFTVRSRWSI